MNNFILPATIALLGAISTVAAVYITKLMERKNSSENRLKQKKMEIYNELLDGIRIMYSEFKNDGDVKIPDGLTSKAVTWASTDVLIHFYGVTGCIKEAPDWGDDAEQKFTELIESTGFLLYAVRKDLGYPCDYNKIEDIETLGFLFFEDSYKDNGSEEIKGTLPNGTNLS